MVHFIDFGKIFSLFDQSTFAESILQSVFLERFCEVSFETCVLDNISKNADPVYYLDFTLGRRTFKNDVFQRNSIDVRNSLLNAYVLIV